MWQIYITWEKRNRIGITVRLEQMETGRGGLRLGKDGRNSGERQLKAGGGQQRGKLET